MAPTPPIDVVQLIKLYNTFAFKETRVNRISALPIYMQTLKSGRCIKL